MVVVMVSLRKKDIEFITLKGTQYKSNILAKYNDQNVLALKIKRKYIVIKR